MTKLRKLVKDDRVKITGPWMIDSDGDCGENQIGNIETVARAFKPDSNGLSVRLGSGYYWCRENLRALPRKVKQ